MTPDPSWDNVKKRTPQERCPYGEETLWNILAESRTA